MISLGLLPGNTYSAILERGALQALLCVLCAILTPNNMDYHKWLYRSRRLVAEVEAAMGNLSEHIALDDALPNLFYNGETDARTVKRKLKEARMVFRESWWAISDRWTTIRGNEALELELRKHLRDYIRFRDSTRILISTILEHPHKAAALDFGNLNWNNLRAFLDELDDDMRPALLAYGDGLLQTKYDTCDLTGIATRMQAFVRDVTDEFFVELIIRRRLPASPLRWHGHKADCARFLRHFGFTDKAANRIFECYSGGKKLEPIKISSSLGSKSDDNYPVMKILKDYPYNKTLAGT